MVIKMIDQTVTYTWVTGQGFAATPVTKEEFYSFTVFDRDGDEKTARMRDFEGNRLTSFQEALRTANRWLRENEEVASYRPWTVSIGKVYNTKKSARFERVESEVVDLG